MDEDIQAFIAKRYEVARRTQVHKNKIDFQITLEEFTDMWKVIPNQIKLVRKILNESGYDSLIDFMNGKHGYVCSWKDKYDYIEGRPMTKDNAAILNRAAAKQVFWLRAGETQTEETKARIAAYRTGQKHSVETKEKQRNAKLGTTDSDETKLRKSEAAKARHAKARAAKETRND